MKRFSLVKFPKLCFIGLLLSSICWASHDAVVTSSRAIIYSDVEMTSPLGYVRKGKKLKVGEIPRNKAQVYPIALSGKIAYIRVIDVSTQREAMDSSKLVAERFKKQSDEILGAKYSLNYMGYYTQVTLPTDNDALSDKDSVTWTGLSLKGEVLLSKRWDMQVILNYLGATQGPESFKMVETGVGAGLRLFELNRFLVEWETQALGVPYSSYAYTDQFRVNGYGFTVGTGLCVATRLGRNWGLEGAAGIYYTKLMGFDPPDPYEAINPTFYGTRVSIGVNYQM